MKSYVIVIVDEMPRYLLTPIISENVRVDFVRIGEVVHGRVFKGSRINVVVNRTKYRELDKVDDESIAKWWSHVKQGLAKDVEIRDGVMK
ncbi:hypothetical protein [Cytobacillus solani]|uniref:Uncharacterized protein n=1 Tax=Cytobacillus solani TaxID=1637975 RepID=A0A0Q3QLF8_9BACI|nr:hypothetical protein [Cytobacillus solani]KQL18833.1 hypothetical protein AN957_09790 [Cytobacillus solani]